jgi:hypothetical protein
MIVQVFQHVTPDPDVSRETVPSSSMVKVVQEEIHPST